MRVVVKAMTCLCRAEVGALDVTLVPVRIPKRYIFSSRWNTAGCSQCFPNFLTFRLNHSLIKPLAKPIRLPKKRSKCFHVMHRFVYNHKQAAFMSKLKISWILLRV